MTSQSTNGTIGGPMSDADLIAGIRAVMARDGLTIDRLAYRLQTSVAKLERWFDGEPARTIFRGKIRRFVMTELPADQIQVTEREPREPRIVPPVKAEAVSGTSGVTQPVNGGIRVPPIVQSPADDKPYQVGPPHPPPSADFVRFEPGIVAGNWTEPGIRIARNERDLILNRAAIVLLGGPGPVHIDRRERDGAVLITRADGSSGKTFLLTKSDSINAVGAIKWMRSHGYAVDQRYPVEAALGGALIVPMSAAESQRRS